MRDKIEGVPDGWELVRIGTPIEGESYICSGGIVGVCESYRCAKNYVIVRKIEPPKPVYIPWTYETCPRGVWVRCNDNGSEMAISIISYSGVTAGVNYWNYDRLMERFTQLDGTPCGTIEVQG
jgi:hypothetical protein